MMKSKLSFNIKKCYKAGIIPFVKDKNENTSIILVRPTDPKFGGNMPQICKGMVDKKEPVRAAAVRELKQEVGIGVEKIDLINTYDIVKYHKIPFFTNSYELSVFCTKLKEKFDLTNLENDGEVTADWYDLSQASKIIRLTQREILKDFISFLTTEHKDSHIY